MSKSVLLFVLIGALAAAALIEAWTLTQVQDLQTTRSAICQLVDQSNSNVNASRDRITTAALREHARADADRNVATTLAGLGNDATTHQLVQDFQRLANEADAAGKSLDAQASGVKQFHLAGC